MERIEWKDMRTLEETERGRNENQISESSPSNNLRTCLQHHDPTPDFTTPRTRYISRPNTTSNQKLTPRPRLLRTRKNAMIQHLSRTSKYHDQNSNLELKRTTIKLPYHHLLCTPLQPRTKWINGSWLVCCF